MNEARFDRYGSLATVDVDAGGDVAIVNLSDNIKKILLITRLQSAFSIHDKMESALAFFEKETKNN